MPLQKIYNLHNFHHLISRKILCQNSEAAFPKSKENALLKVVEKNFKFPQNTKKNSLSRFAHVNSRRRSVSPFGYRVVHPDALPVDFHSRALFFGYFGVFCALEIDEGEAS